MPEMVRLRHQIIRGCTIATRYITLVYTNAIWAGFDYFGHISSLNTLAANRQIAVVIL